MCRVLVPIFFVLLIFISGDLDASVGGQDAEPEEAPWMVALIGGGADDDVDDGAPLRDRFLCGGALIHPYWVATAAHCVVNAANPRVKEMKVVVGVRDLSNPDLSILQTVEVADIVVQPRFLFSRSGDATGDLALLRLKRPITGVMPLELLDETSATSPGAPARLFGWGAMDESDDRAEILQRVDVPFVAQEISQQSWGQHAIVLGIDTVSVGTNDGKLGSCGGDSGGPLVVRILEPGPSSRERWALAGVLSQGSRPCGAAGFYTVATSISFHRSWILSHIHAEYARWIDEFDVPRRSGDKDRDGVGNFMEFAFGTNPCDTLDWRTPGVRVVRVVRNGNSNLLPLEYSFQRPTVATGLSYSIERSNDLVTWSTDATDDGKIESIDLGNGIAQISVRPAALVGSTGGEFLRLDLKHSAQFESTFARRPREDGLFVQGALGSSVLGSEFPQENRFLRIVDPGDLAPGQLTTLFCMSEDFSPRLRIIETEFGQVELEVGALGRSSLVVPFVPHTGIRYRFEVSSMEEDAEGEFLFHFPQVRLAGGGLPLPLGGGAVSGQLTTHSDFDGAYYSDAYVLTQVAIGRTGRKATITLRADGDDNGFRPFLAVLDQREEMVAMSDGAPVDTTSVSFVIEDGSTYFVFATTLEPMKQGFYTIEASVVLED
jgi:hypothetical protein